MEVEVMKYVLIVCMLFISGCGIAQKDSTEEGLEVEPASEPITTGGLTSQEVLVVVIGSFG